MKSGAICCANFRKVTANFDVLQRKQIRGFLSRIEDEGRKHTSAPPLFEGFPRFLRL